MMGKTAVVVQGEQHLLDLAGQINSEHRLCEQSFREGLQHAIRAGELLIEAKALCQHGEWLGWLRDNCDVSERAAQAYMRVARNREVLESKAQRVADLSFRDAVALLAEPKPEAGDDERLSLIPSPGHGRLGGFTDHNGKYMAFIMPSVHEGYYNVSVMWSEVNKAVNGGTIEGTKRPIKGDYIHLVLKALNVPAGGIVEWGEIPAEPEPFNRFLFFSFDDYIRRALLGLEP